MADSYESSVGEIKVSEIEDSAVARIAAEVYEDRDTITAAELMGILELDLNMSLTEVTISSGETRQVRQYEPNNYHASVKIDLSGTKETMLEAVKAAPVGSKIDVYAEQKRLLFTLVSKKYEHFDRFLRQMFSDRQRDHGIVNRS